MAPQEFCKSCKQKHDCQKVYEQLGNNVGPSVVFKVIAAFGLPLVVFIVSLAASQGILAKAINTKELQTALSLLTALLTTAVVVVSCSLLVARRNGT